MTALALLVPLPGHAEVDAAGTLSAVPCPAYSWSSYLLFLLGALPALFSGQDPTLDGHRGAQHLAEGKSDAQSEAAVQRGECCIVFAGSSAQPCSPCLDTF